ncbi:hypothetical protein EST38_g8051 [Candolleomyces aberdarensis]|uniref:Nephrocystin 3-like N-terminal domain-containing protein n=1 Tax=Candolleomyces aberdarensis TaxID=2316362 RepID=A0A4V1Q394_9AGAR|nr:hypothetical protein EST38_g8051 [Candolleomyces aberdarensis]
MAHLEFFNNSRGVQAETIKFITNVSSPASVGALEKLKAHIAAGAIHDSRERCDAPKCHPDTRVAVQDDLYSWITDGDGETEQPKKIKWVTGPAGTGKTAVMGSLSKRCKSGGVLAATFFFVSWSASIGRRRKTALVATIAHQLARYHPDLREEISKVIEADSDIFDKDLHTQMEVLVLGPLQEIACRSNKPDLRGAIIDGVDECEAEQYHEDTTTGYSPPLRTNDQDQLEILQVLQAASSDPSFPFRILVASRPERVFREFFDPESNPTPFAQKLDLHEEYNADADITLFLEAQFNRIRRRYNLPPSWPPPGAIQTLVKNASGQFIYAATIIRYLETDHREPPKALLEAILKMEAKGNSNPLKQLDILYSRIMGSSPDPFLSPTQRVASDQATTKYEFYHKSLFDFLNDAGRCGGLYVEHGKFQAFIWDAFAQTCKRGCDSHCSYPETFLQYLSVLPETINISTGNARSKLCPTLASAGWWVSLTVARQGYDSPSLRRVFFDVHGHCLLDGCKLACRVWSLSILRHLGSDVPWDRRASFQTKRFTDLVDAAKKDAQQERGASVKEAKEGAKKRTSGALGTAAESSTASSSSKPKRRRTSKSRNRR